MIPWLDAARPLVGQRILEVGCGTGSSTIALAEQGAEVTAVDIDDGALAVARDRTAAYGIEADFRCLNASQLADTFGPAAFDHVIFFASLEHMTLSERLSSLRDAWAMLDLGGLMTIVETPNRLWWFDNHTALMPFVHWLPDELAFNQSRHSSRENFRELYRDWTPDKVEHFLRRGRGMSYHELDAAVKPVRELDVVSSLSSFWGSRYSLRQSRLDRQFKTVLRKMQPGLHQGYFDDLLYLVIRK